MVEIISGLLDWQIYIYLSIGIAIGLTVGCIPGMTASLGVALVLPFTFFLTPINAIAILIGIYKAGMFGGAISAITFGTPGTPAASADVFDGYELTKLGQAKKALQLALYSSVTGDIGSDVCLLLVVAPLSTIALAFGPREMFALLVFSLIMVIIFVKESPIRAIIATLLGLLIGIVGTDPIAGVSRLTLGVWQLSSGINLLPFLIGLFACAELITQIIKVVQQNSEQLIRKLEFRKGGKNLTFKEFIRCYREIIIGWAIGTFLGALPGLGGTLAAYGSYAIAKKTSKNRENFGKGALEGLAAPESANSATCGATFIPMFAFGIPGNSIAALFMGAFLLQGITPGPGLLRDHREVMYSILILIIIANFFNLFIGRIMTPLYAYIAYLPSSILIPMLGALCTLGVFATRGSTFDVIIMVAAGLLGYFMRAHKFPLAPCLIGFILARMIEANLRRSLLIAKGNLLYLFGSPISIVFYLVILILLIFLIVSNIKKKKKSLNDNI
jgi:putative tricarboxylic transport membrane protein